MFLPFVILWALLALTVLGVLVWRRLVASKEDDYLHVMDGAAVEKGAEQIALAQKLDVIDKWGKLLTIVTVIYGVILAFAYVWSSWVHGSNVSL